MRLTFRPEDIPIDQHISERTVRGILDGPFNPINIVKLQGVLGTNTPGSDASLLIDAPLPVDPELLQPKELDPNHDCGDPNCPHKATISPLAAMLASVRSDNKRVDLTHFELFRYPIISISRENWQMMALIAGVTTQNMMRFAVGFEANSEVFKLSGAPDFIEGLYFWDGPPKSIEILINDNPQKVTIPCDRKYVFLGMHMNSPYYQVSFRLPEGSKGIKFGLIFWITPEEQIIRYVQSEGVKVQWGNLQYEWKDGGFKWTNI